MIRRLWRDLQLLALAFALALMVWISAVVSADPDETRLYPRAIPLSVVGQDPSMTIIGGLPASVQVSLRAPRSVWETINTEQQAVHAVIDLSGLAAGEHTLRVQTQLKVAPARLVSVDPAQVTFSLENLETRYLSLNLEVTGDPAVGYQAEKPRLETSRASISGPQSLVRQVQKLQIQASIANARASYEASLPILALDAEGRPLSGLTISPAQVKISVPIKQQGGYRDVAVKVVVRGQLAGGYRLTNISVFPPIVTVYSGDASLVNALPGYVETEPLNLNNASEQIDARLALNLPGGISVIGDQTVQAQVGVAAIEGSLSLKNLPVTLIGLGPGLKAVVSPSLVDIILTGPLPVLEALQFSKIVISIDVTGLSIGTYQITPQVTLEENTIQVQSINPATVEVLLTLSP